MSKTKPYNLTLDQIPVGSQYESEQVPGAIFEKKFTVGSGAEPEPWMTTLTEALWGLTPKYESTWVFDPSGQVEPGEPCSLNTNPNDRFRLVDDN